MTTSNDSLDEGFFSFNYEDIPRLALEVVSKRCRRVAVQCPDESLETCPLFVQELEKSIEQLYAAEQISDDILELPIVVLLADTAAGKCCVDEVAAEHYAADCIIHLGPSCQARTSRRTRVLYSFPKASFCETHFNNTIVNNTSQDIQTKSLLVVVYSVEYHHSLNSIASVLFDLSRTNQLPSEIVIAVPRLSQNLNTSTDTTISQECQSALTPLFDRDLFKLSPIQTQTNEPSLWSLTPIEQESIFYQSYWDWCNRSDLAFLYIGPTDLHIYSQFFFRFALRFGTDRTIFIYNPCEASSESLQTIKDFSRPISQIIMARYAAIEAAKPASIIGLVYGTVGVLGHLKIHERLKSLCRAKNKQVISLVVGKINVPKLENFPEIDTFCLISCPESAYLENYREFSKPILSPFELEISLGVREWDTEFVVDFQEFLAVPPIASSDQIEETDSTVLGNRFNDGKIISTFNNSESCNTLNCHNNDILCTTNNDNNQLVESLHSKLTPLKNRTFQGVPLFSNDPTPDLQIYEGLSGIASSYQSELHY